MVPCEKFHENLIAVQERITKACAQAGRDPATVQLMPVTKRHPVEAVKLAAEAGLRRIGENRVQEAAAKRAEAEGQEVLWEIIGPVQSNKARLAVETADRIQTVDRLKLVRLFDRLAGERGGAPMPILLQVNVGEDPAKHGCAVEETPWLLEAALAAPNLHVEGLMTIGELSTEESVVRRTFARLRELRDKLEAEAGQALPELSMGMTGDLEWAIEEGSTLVRVGTALFGERDR